MGPEDRGSVWSLRILGWGDSIHHENALAVMKML
jgi:hypothetical protein